MKSRRIHSPAHPRPGSGNAAFPGVAGTPGALWLLLLCCGVLLGCGPRGPEVVVYVAQDRVFAEPLLGEFTRATGIAVRAIYDSEVTKTVGLANRLAAEAAKPRADLWWSNEELRTRQLIRQGVLEGDPARFGERRRVWVVRTNDLSAVPAGAGLSVLTNATLQARAALAYPLFGTTATHFLVLRQRWGNEAWEAWCRALVANRPLIVDGNSVVVKLVASGQVAVGLTDSDDVAAARREGLPVLALPLGEADGLAIPNTVARVKGAPHPREAETLARHLGGEEVRRRLVEVGALDPAPAGTPPRAAERAPDWDRLLSELDAAVTWLQGHFTRQR